MAEVAETGKAAQCCGRHLQTAQIEVGDRACGFEQGDEFLQVYFIGDRQTPTNTTFSVYFLDDDYITPGSARPLTMTSTNPAPVMYRCGTFKKRSIAIEFQSTGGSLPRIEALEMDIEFHAT